MQPSDVRVFTARTLHGARGNSRSDCVRRVIAMCYVDNNVRWVEGLHVLNLAFQQPNLNKDDPLDHPYFLSRGRRVSRILRAMAKVSRFSLVARFL